MRLQSFNEKENFPCQCARLILLPNVEPKAKGTRRGGSAEGSRVPVLCSCLVLSQNAWASAGLQRTGTEWGRSAQPPSCCSAACRPWEFQKPLDSRPAYTSRWPFRMGCGNSRNVSSGILINTPSNNARLLVPTIRGENYSRERRCSAAVLLPAPCGSTRRGSTLSTFFLSSRESSEVLQRSQKDNCYRSPALAIPPQPAERDGKNAGSPYLIVWVWNGGRTLSLLTCNRGREVVIDNTARGTVMEMISG